MRRPRPHNKRAKMRYDLNKFPLGSNDEQLRQPDNVSLATWRETLIMAVTQEEQGSPVRGKVKFDRYDVYKKLKGASQYVDLSIDQVKILSDLCDVFPIIVAGQMKEFLESPEGET